MATLYTLIEDTHGLISTSDLNLLKVSLRVIAFRTRRRSLVHVVPRVRSPQHVVHRLARLRESLSSRLSYSTLEGTGCTHETGCFHAKDVGAEGTEPHERRKGVVGLLSWRVIWRVPLLPGFQDSCSKTPQLEPSIISRFEEMLDFN